MRERTKKEKREFYIPKLDRERSLYGTEFEIKLRNQLSQKAIAKECAEWVNAAELSLRFDSQSMDGIYESLVRQVAADKICSDHSDLQTAIEQTSQREAMLKEIATLERQIATERQPIKRFILHKRLNELKGIL